MKKLDVDLTGKKCRYCGRQATQAFELEAYTFLSIKPTHTEIFYLCDSKVWGDCQKAKAVRG